MGEISNNKRIFAIEGCIYAKFLSLSVRYYALWSEWDINSFDKGENEESVQDTQQIVRH